MGYNDITLMEGKSVTQKKRKVLFLITKGNWGGAQRYVFDLATNLPRSEFNTLVAFGEGEVLQNKLDEATIKSLRIDSLKRDVDLFSDIKTFFVLLKLLRAERPDILHVNSSKAGSLGALAGRLCGIEKIIFTGHGWAWNEERALISKFLIKFIHWITILLSTETIAVADKIREQIEHMPFVSKKIRTIHNGINPIKFNDRHDARRDLSLGVREKIWIGAISELHKNKGLDYLIKAFSKIAEKNHDVALVIVGDGEEKISLMKLAEEIGMKERVYFLGFVQNASMYLKAFDVFTLTSRTEAFPYAILEAGLAQVPIVASNVGGIPEAIKNGESGILVERGDIESIKQSLAFLMTDSSRAAEFSQAMRKRVEQLFSLPLMVEKTIAVYNE